MPDTDPIQDFMALPREQQLATLQGLDLDKQDKLLAQVKQRRGAAKPAPAAAQPSTPAQEPGILDPHPGGNSVVEFLRGGASGVTSLFMHPVDSIFGMPNLGGMPGVAFGPAGAASVKAQSDAVKENAGTVRKTIDDAASHPAYTAGSLVIPGLLGEAAGRVLPKAVESTGTAIGPGKRTITDLVDKTRKANVDSAAAAADANKAATEKTLADRGKVDEANARQAEADKQARLKVQRENKATAEAHAAGKADTEAANREAVRQQEKIKPTQQKLEHASADLRAREETAREKALKVGNEKYDTVREKLNNVPADQEAIMKAYGEALHSLGEAGQVPPILKRMEKMTQEPLSYKDNQILYSELGKELFKGTLSGPTYHAYDILHEAIGKDMQRIANDNGMGAELSDARNYWRRMKQTFGKRLTQNDNATAAVQSANPEFVSADAQANRLRLLGSFDPEIPKVAEYIENLKQGVASLPKEAPLRDVVKVPDTAPDLKPVPKPKPAQAYPEPRPTVAATETKLGPEEVRAAKKDTLDRGVKSVRYGGNTYANTAIALKAIYDVFNGNFPGIAEDVAARTVFHIGKKAVANLLDRPEVVEFLTKPTAADLAAIPPELRKNFPSIVEEAKRQGVKVSPALLRNLGIAAGAVKGPKTQELEALRDGK